MTTERERFRARRKELKLSQQTVAEAADVSLRTVQNYESGGASPQPSNREAMWAVLGGDTDAPAAESTEGTTWPTEVAVFLDIMGAYLERFPEPERLRLIHDITRQIFTSRNRPE